ncbi:MAG TPA: sulfatase-like hydrolase/transferase, partial [Burkholderiaceae bacterium]|nr:sulfatase-like hydrolase/transferase [Burkholderiaceae bacterium]
MNTTTRPNIIFIVADDLGYADLGCYGGREAVFGPVSPVLDRLAAQGALFTQGYANSPVCSPTRFGMITARYQYRLRGAAEEPINSKSRGSDTLGMPPEHPTLPSLLKDAGYRTALIGKWHLGHPPHFGPLRSGYEEFFGPMAGGVDYFTHCDSRGTHDLYEGAEASKAEGYLTDLLSRRAVDYVDRMAEGDAPFFLSLHYTAPHWPWETREDADRAPAVKDNLFDLAGGNIHVYRRMIHHMDEGIGWIVEALRRNGQLDNTLIVFTSDNGGERFSDNWPLVGGKMDLTEGGIRVPWIAHWPAVIAPGSQSRQLCMTMDWSATMLDAAGVAAHPDYP